MRHGLSMRRLSALAALVLSILILDAHGRRLAPAPPPPPAVPAAAPAPPAEGEAGMEEGWRPILEVILFEVGEGNALLVRALVPEEATGSEGRAAGEAGEPGDRGRSILVDGADLLGGPALAAQLSRAGVEALDLVILLSPRAERVGGLPAALARIPVAEAIVPTFEVTGALYRESLHALDRAGATIRQAEGNPILPLGAGAEAQLFAPGAGWEPVRAPGLVALRVAAGAASLLVPGDLDAPTEGALVRLWPERLRSDILVTGRNGDESATSALLLDAVRPRLALLQTGPGNERGHPHPEVLKRLAEAGTALWRTDRDGPLHLETDGRLWRWRPLRVATLRGGGYTGREERPEGGQPGDPAADQR